MGKIKAVYIGVITILIAIAALTGVFGAFFKSGIQFITVPVYIFARDNCEQDRNIMAALQETIFPINGYAGCTISQMDETSSGTGQSAINEKKNLSADKADKTASADMTAPADATAPTNETTSTEMENPKDGNAQQGENAVGSDAAAQPDGQAAGEASGTMLVPDGQEEGVQSAEVISRNIIGGTVYPRESLNSYDFVLNHFYTVTSVTKLGSDKLRPQEFLNKDMTMKQDASAPQILIFHTHSQEGFADSVEGDSSTTIVGAGEYLAALLREKYGYNVIHDTGVYDLVNGKLDRSKAYTYAEEALANTLKENPTIEVVIDLHRDGVSDETHLVTEIDGKRTAKIMFFNGLSYSRINGDISYLYNPNRDDNLAFSLQLQLIGQAYYPDYLRRIYINAYRYCLHMRGKSLLIEAGAQNNTFEEVKNAMEPLADILDKSLRGERTWPEG